VGWQPTNWPTPFFFSDTGGLGHHRAGMERRRDAAAPPPFASVSSTRPSPTASISRPPPRLLELPTLAASGSHPHLHRRAPEEEKGGRGERGVDRGGDVHATAGAGGRPWSPWTLRSPTPRHCASSASSTGAAYILFTMPSFFSPPPSPSGHADRR
jgi:hypothetical protein